MHIEEFFSNCEEVNYVCVGEMKTWKYYYKREVERPNFWYHFGVSYSWAPCGNHDSKSIIS